MSANRLRGQDQKIAVSLRPVLMHVNGTEADQ